MAQGEFTEDGWRVLPSGPACANCGADLPARSRKPPPQPSFIDAGWYAVFAFLSLLGGIWLVSTSPFVFLEVLGALMIPAGFLAWILTTLLREARLTRYALYELLDH